MTSLTICAMSLITTFGSSSGMEIDRTNEKKANNKPAVQNASVLDFDSEALRGGHTQKLQQ